MAREKIPSPGFDEPGESSVLSLAPENERAWFLNAKEEHGPWLYCPAIYAICEENVGFNIGPQFKCEASGLGAFRYECQAKWHTGSVPISLTSGMCDSTLEAFERICSQIKSLPSLKALNWTAALAKELPRFREMKPPRFVNTTELGLPTIVCTLNWGNSATQLEASSRPYQSRIHAFHDAIEAARAIGPAPEPAPPINLIDPAIKKSVAAKSINWEHAARRQCMNRGPIGEGQLKVSFPPGKSGNNVSCKIRWGQGLMSAVESFPMDSQDDAFAQAVQLLKRDLLVYLSKNTKRKVEIVTHTPRVHVNDPLDAQAKTLLDLAKRHWSVERSWLMGHPLQTKERIQRLHDLNTFLVLLDPLRCYEIDRGARDVAIGRITTELQTIHSHKNEGTQRVRHTAQLRALVGQIFAEAGTAVAMTDAFSAHTRSSGVKPEDAIAELVQSQLLRQLSNGKLSISTLGANLMERNLTTGIQPGSLGSTLPQGVALLLLTLKDSLTDL